MLKLHEGKVVYMTLSLSKRISIEHDLGQYESCIYLEFRRTELSKWEEVVHCQAVSSTALMVPQNLLLVIPSPSLRRRLDGLGIFF